MCAERSSRRKSEGRMRESRKSNATEVITGRSVNVFFLYRLQSGCDPKVF